MKRNVFVFRGQHDPVGSGIPMQATEPPYRTAPPRRDASSQTPGTRVEPGAIDLEGLIAAVPLLGMETCWPETDVG